VFDSIIDELFGLGARHAAGGWAFTSRGGFVTAGFAIS
jgi:hypothetical protein